MTMNNVDLRPITAENHKALKDARDGEAIPFAALGKVVLFGLGHAPAAMRIVNTAGSRANFGTIRVTRLERGSTQKGTLKVGSFRQNAAERADFTAGVKLFTDMKVEFA